MELEAFKVLINKLYLEQVGRTVKRPFVVASNNTGLRVDEIMCKCNHCEATWDEPLRIGIPLDVFSTYCPECEKPNEIISYMFINEN